jgi:hypothetical protein
MSRSKALRHKSKCYFIFPQRRRCHLGSAGFHNILFPCDEFRDQRSDTRQDLYLELIPLAQILLWLKRVADSGWGAGQDNGTGRQSRALRDEGDDLGDGEDQVCQWGGLQLSVVLESADMQG